MNLFEFDDQFSSGLLSLTYPEPPEPFADPEPEPELSGFSVTELAEID